MVCVTSLVRPLSLWRSGSFGSNADCWSDRGFWKRFIPIVSLVFTPCMDVWRSRGGCGARTGPISCSAQPCLWIEQLDLQLRGAPEEASERSPSGCSAERAKMDSGKLCLLGELSQIPEWLWVRVFWRGRLLTTEMLRRVLSNLPNNHENYCYQWRPD